MGVLFIGLYSQYAVIVRKNKGGRTMGDIIMILGLALYVPMSMVYLFSERS